MTGQRTHLAKIGQPTPSSSRVTVTGRRAGRKNRVANVRAVVPAW